MSSANLTIDRDWHSARFFARLKGNLSLATLRPRKLLVVANALSLARGISAMALFAAGFAGASPVALVAIASPMWITDFADGRVARKGHKALAKALVTRRIDGAALDPLMDDVAYIAGYFVLLSVNAIPLWFVGALLGTRVLFALVRLGGLAQHRDPDRFAFSDPITKVNGATLAIGQLLLLAHLTSPHLLIGTSELAVATAIALTIANTCTLIYFAAFEHRQVFVDLLTP
ncbi:MAG TPA: CDP-alcohol phosphatidyltransferase family protein [Solirubrobacteraceae bacterium]|nr:CDP-alcohol phosphatidyltransferase family protein [Solirubrobacteraceae bacterium]